MPKHDYEALISKADAAVEYAQSVRAHHRFRSKRTNSKRQADLHIALSRLRKAMEPIRGQLGRVQFETTSQARLQKQERLRDASHNIQRERRKLWKMLDHKKEEA